MTTPYNPYSAPQPGYSSLKSWSTGEALSLAWGHFKEHWFVLASASLVGGLITEIPSFVQAALLISRTIEKDSTESTVVKYVCGVIGWIIGTFIGIGLMRMSLDVVRGGVPSFGTLFSGGDRFAPTLLAGLLTGLIVCLGFVALIVPGFILGLGLFLTQYFVIDAKLGPVAALKASWNATKGYKGELFLLTLASTLICMIGFFACCIGLFAAMPIYSLAIAIAYTRLSGNGPAPAAGPEYPPIYPSPPGYPPPPPGYLPPPPGPTT